MSKKSLKIEIETPGWGSIESTDLIKEIKEKVVAHLNKENLYVSDSIINNSCKNALSLARSKKKVNSKILPVYIPRSLVDSSLALSPISVSSTDTNDNSGDAHDYLLTSNDAVQQVSRLTFDYTDDKGLIICTRFIFIKDNFYEFLNRSSKSINISNFINEICHHCFHSTVKFYVDVPKLRRQLYSQLSCIVRDAKKKANATHTTVTKVLMEKNTFLFHSNAVEPINNNDEFSCLNFDTYVSVNSSDRVLLVRHTDTICIQPGNTCLHLHISESFALRAFEFFDLHGSIDINEILVIISRYCHKRQIMSDITKTEETIKTTILDRKINNVESNIFTCTILLDNLNYSVSNEENVDLDLLLGPVYSTRGTKRKNQTVPFDSENSNFEESSDENDDLWQSNKYFACKNNDKESPVSIKQKELKRKFLHIKDEHHITDSAIKAMHQFFKETKESFYSMAELDHVRNKSNQKIPLKFTKDSAYVPFDFALRIAIFVAIKFRPDLLKLNQLSFRLNMDGTLMGNKHVVAVSVNCVDGGLPCQTAKKLVPVGIFEIQKESNELLRKTLPKDFLDSIQSVKYLNVTRKKTVAVKIRLGGDFQNAVYVFGLAGVHCNYPCVFCTQNKSYLHVTERNTECEEEIWVGTGKNKKKQKQKTIVNPTSSYDPTRGARTLKEKRIALEKKEKNKLNNELGYQSEPLFGDLFEFSDYVMDTLHMRLRIFDIILKDILAEASRTGEYEPVHTKKLEEKLEILNKHSIATIGKRFFFKLETENNIKTIVPCGRFSGHLQQSFFVNSFPYEKLIENETISKNAKNLVEKFKFMIQLIRTEKSKRTSVLADVAKSFVKDFRQSGLRTGCTPYMHLIGNHLAEQDENENLTAYDMQGVEKSNDLLSRLYFSSSNRAKTPLRTMMQSLYRRLEMNFTDPNERVEMARYALNGTFDEVDSEEDENVTDTVLNHSVELNKSNEFSTDDSDAEESVIETDDENLDQAPAYISQSYSRTNGCENRWKSFKKA
ncbi:unnamed protein product [Rotaria magnacalcarata]|uniref:Uncharacterized protein n=6 Tax=Rotaria magnacalcarata TaxID=392030 RepID=A0A816T3F6_9BILA|nr:unnamed protein product [Rotaria magnacalcarata]CAF4107961.1 unnamed protein product [Rotaria magnacalcarata]